MNKILKTSITGDAERDKMIKAAILTNAIGERTGKSANRRELLAAYEATKFLSNNKDLVEPEEKPQATPPTTTPPEEGSQTPPPTATPPEEEPCTKKRNVLLTDQLSHQAKLEVTANHHTGLLKLM